MQENIWKQVEELYYSTDDCRLLKATKLYSKLTNCTLHNALYEVKNHFNLK